MNLTTECSQITFSITSHWGAFILFWIIIELMFIFSTKMSIIHKIIILPYVFYQINKMIPKHWSIRSHWMFLFFKRYKFNRYEMYVTLKSKINYDGPSVNSNGSKKFYEQEILEHLVINLFGKIISQNFTSEIEKIDSKYKNQVKQWCRDQNLKKLGL